MQTLGTFYNNKIFEIPPQQRPYSWETIHVKALLDDLRIAMDRNEEHYCGPAFLDRTRNHNGIIHDVLVTPMNVNLTRHDVLDGQQRITTVMLIAAALVKDEEIVVGITNGNIQAATVQGQLKDLYAYAMGPEQANGDDPEPDTSRLEYNDLEMNLAMKHLLFEDPPNLLPNQITKSSTVKLINNFNYVKNNINIIFETNGDLNTKINVCRKFLQAMKMEMIMMEQHSFNKYTVFESINNRGLGLSEFDKIKNLTLHIADQHQKRCADAGLPATLTKLQVQTHWHQTLTHLYSYQLEKDETRCITDLWKVIYNQGTGKESDAFTKFKNKFQSLVDKDSNNKMNQLLIYLNHWASYTESYCKIYTKKPGHELSLANMTPGTKTNLDRILNKIKLGDEFKLPLTSAFLRYNNTDFEKFSECMEKALFRMHGIKVPGQSLSRGRAPFTSLAQNIFSLHQGLNDSISEICRYVTELAPFGGANGLVEHFISGNEAYGKWRGFSLYYFLHRVDNLLSPGNVGWVDDDEERDNQKEHILPNSHVQYWSNTWPIEDTADRWKNRLGNLTLTENNQSNVHLYTYDITNKCRTNPNYTYDAGRHIERRVVNIATMFSTSERWEKLEILLHELHYSRNLVKLWSLPCDCDLEDFTLTDDSKQNLESYFTEMTESFEDKFKTNFTELHASEDYESVEYDNFKKEQIIELKAILDIDGLVNYSPREIVGIENDEIIIPCVMPDEEE